MKIIKFMGGLGNQMFQYAFYENMSKYDEVRADLSEFSQHKMHNGYELKNVFNIDVNIASEAELNKYKVEKNIVKKIIRKLNKNIVNHRIIKPYFYDDTIFGKKNLYLEGDWQNINYLDNENRLRVKFKFISALKNKNKELMEKIKEDDKAICIHIRRGDYLESKECRNIYGGICTLDYYNNAIKYIANRINEPNFYVFSNDILWVEENLNLKNAIFINWNKGESSYIDMQLMSLCKHNIIANSTFSWWGAFLNENKNKIVIAPKKWTNNYENSLIFDQWIRL